jgi:type II secretion system protein I
MFMRTDSSAGFTLIEVTVALAIVALVLTGALTAASTDARATQATIDALIGATLAEDRLAEALAWPQPDAAKRTFADPLQRFASEVRYGSAKDTGTELVRVTVSWPGGSAVLEARRPTTTPTAVAPDDLARGNSR